MNSLRIYEKPTCSTCRKLRELLDERGVEYETIDYHKLGIDEPQLRRLLSMLECDARAILRTREPLVSELGLDDTDFDEDRLIGLMCANPTLVQRPIAVQGQRAVLARPIELALDLL